MHYIFILHFSIYCVINIILYIYIDTKSGSMVYRGSLLLLLLFCSLGAAKYILKQEENSSTRDIVSID